MTKWISIIGFAVFTTGCAPLQQAPLVYSSKTVFGADISTPTSESPGISMSVGFKQVDAAYVPVAVSNNTKNARGELVDSKEITPIVAVYGTGTSRGSFDGTSSESESRRKIAAYLQAFQLVKDKKSTLDESNKLLSNANQELNNKISEQKSIDEKIKKEKDTKINPSRKNSTDHTGTPPTEAASNPTQKSEKPDDQSNIELIEEQETKEQENREIQLRKTSKELEHQKSELDKIISKLKENSSAAENEYEKAEKRAKELFDDAAQAASLLRTEKKDALSVYGRFDSNGIISTNVGSTTSLTAGKIFSTGVASQNLTEAAKVEALYAGSHLCIRTMLDAAKSITDSKSTDNVALSNKLTSSIPEVCGVSAEALKRILQDK